jgi:hypothetical protein
MLFFDLCLSHPSGIFSSGFQTKIVYAFLNSAIYNACPTHLILFDFIILLMFGEEYELQSSLLCNFLHSHITSCLVYPSIPTTALFSDSFS